MLSNEMSRSGLGSARLVGRERELAVLQTALVEAEAGSPSFMLVTGEAGIGKSSLVDTFLTGIDVTRLLGGCVPVAGEAMPFAPVIGAFRRLAQAWTGDERARLLNQVPVEFAHVLGWGAGTQPVPEQRDGHSLDAPLSGSAQSRLFESLLSLLAELTSERAVVWVLEDLHWADRSTLDLLSFLARSLRNERVVVILTVRSDALPREDPLRTWLAEIDRLPLTKRLTLERLGREDTALQIADLVEHTVLSPRLVDVVYDHSAGNPLFTEQLCPWAQQPDRSIPETLHDLVVAMFTTLPEETRELLETAAVVGHECPLDLLSAIQGSPDAEVEALLRPAVDHQVMRAGPGAGYSFVHPMFREVLAADLMPGRKRRLHAEAARCLGELPAPNAAVKLERTGQIAHHWEAAGVADLAFDAAVEAGVAAQEVYAFAEADEYLSRAVRLFREGEDATRRQAGTGVGQVELLVRAAQAAHLMGDGSRAVALAAEAATLSGDDPVRCSEILERKGAYGFNAGLVDDAQESYRKALGLLPPEESKARARVHAGLGLLAMAWSRLDEAEESCREAIRIARIVGARQEEGRALNALGVVMAYRGEYDAGIESSRESVAIAVELADPDDLATAYIDLAHVLGLAGRYDEAVTVCRLGYDAMRAVGLVRQDGSFLQANAADALIKAGRWAEASTLLDEALGQRPQGVRSFAVLQQGARLSLAKGELDSARLLTDQARSLFDDHAAPDSWQRELYELETELLLWEHRPEDAFGVADQGLRLIESGDEQLFAGPLVLLATRAVADLFELARSAPGRGDEERVTQMRSGLEARAAALRPDPTRSGGHTLFEGAAVAASIHAERGRSDGSASSDTWAEVARVWESTGQPFRTAYAQWREAEAAVLAKQPGGATTTSVRRAYDAATALGAEALRRELEQLAQWARVDIRRPVSEVTDPQDQPGEGAPQGLTPRELEVLAGLVAGRTNGEIAESLFISVKTASVHVSNILRKLHVTNREEAARVAYRSGIPPAT